jgi:hypothetical protein
MGEGRGRKEWVEMGKRELGGGGAVGIPASYTI